MEIKMSRIGQALLVQMALYLLATLGLGFLPEWVSGVPFASVLLKLAVFLPPIILYSRLSGYRPTDKSISKKQSFPTLAKDYILALALIVTLMNTVGYLTSLALKGNISSSGYDGIAQAAEAFITSVILASVLEELLFRGAFFHASEGMNGAVRVALSGLFFALMHYSLLQFFYALSAGVVIALLYKRNGSLGFAILLHAGANLVTWIFTVLRSLGLRTAISELITALAFALIALAGGGIWLLNRKKSPEASDDERFIYISPELLLYISGAILFMVLI